MICCSFDLGQIGSMRYDFHKIPATLTTIPVGRLRAKHSPQSNSSPSSMQGHDAPEIIKLILPVHPPTPAIHPH